MSNATEEYTSDRATNMFDIIEYIRKRMDLDEGSTI